MRRGRTRRNGGTCTSCIRGGKRSKRSCKRTSRRNGGYTSAATYAEHVNGPLSVQMRNSLETTGLNGASPSTRSVGLQGQNVGLAKGGRRRRHH